MPFKIKEIGTLSDGTHGVILEADTIADIQAAGKLWAQAVDLELHVAIRATDGRKDCPYNGQGVA